MIPLGVLLVNLMYDNVYEVLIHMKVISVRVDEKIKAQMNVYKDVNWSEVLRRAIQSRVEVEARLRQKIDRARAMKAAEDMERLRSKTSGRWSGVEEIRRWREARR